MKKCNGREEEKFKFGGNLPEADFAAKSDDVTDNNKDRDEEDDKLLVEMIGAASLL